MRSNSRSDSDMTAYWLMFLFPLLGVFAPVRFSGVLRYLVWGFWALITILFIGLSSEIGGDWHNYLDHYIRIQEDGFYVGKGLGYGFVLWLTSLVDGDIYFVNILCAVLFTVALIVFCWHQPMPWLAYVVATPYLISVIAIGFTRQSVALAFLLFALLCLGKNKYWKYCFLLLVGACFHQSVAVMAPLALLTNQRAVLSWAHSVFVLKAKKPSQLILIIGIIGSLTLAFVYAMFVYLSPMVEFYIFRDQWSSSGGRVRALMNAVPGAIFLLSRKWWGRTGETNSHIWTWLALASIGSLFFVGYFSSAVDRISFYLIPLQLYVWSRVPFLFSDSVIRGGFVVGICLIYAAAFFVWLNFAEHAYYWVPYQTVLFN